MTKIRTATAGLSTSRLPFVVHNRVKALHAYPLKARARTQAQPIHRFTTLENWRQLKTQK